MGKIGTDFYGKVEPLRDSEGRECLYIATKFFHIAEIPIFPTGSVLVISGSENAQGVRGVDIPLSGRSVLAAYTRLIGGIFIVVSVVGVVGALSLGTSLSEIVAYINGLDINAKVGMGVGSALGLLSVFIGMGLYSPTPGYTAALAVKAGLIKSPNPHS